MANYDSEVSHDFNTEEYIKSAAALLQIPLPPPLLPGVIDNFDRIIAIAEPLIAFELPDDVEPAATFNP
jgi:hypothetical protein